MLAMVRNRLLCPPPAMPTGKQLRTSHKSSSARSSSNVAELKVSARCCRAVKNPINLP